MPSCDQSVHTNRRAHSLLTGLGKLADVSLSLISKSEKASFPQFHSLFFFGKRSEKKMIKNMAFGSFFY